jgi:hypothetical protein
MADVRAKHVPAAIDQTAFNCPHCGALAKQFWFTAHADEMKKDATPVLIDDAFLKNTPFHAIEDVAKREEIKRLYARIAKGRPMLNYDAAYRSCDVYNVWFSRCFNCDELAIWIYGHLVWPEHGEAPVPNPDLPHEVRRDYEEASAILDRSPRGAAALLRLAIQRMCKHLGEAGENLNSDIAELVKKGLPRKVQQALDVVRVIGNNAVHPGQIDLTDDRRTAEDLFRLVNLIAEDRITQPKHVNDMFAALPEDARKAIERRDGQG